MEPGRCLIPVTRLNLHGYTHSIKLTANQAKQYIPGLQQY
jgi:hypothetical protein